MISRDFAGLRGTSRDFAGLRGTSRDFAGLRGTSRDVVLPGITGDLMGLYSTGWIICTTGNQMVEYLTKVDCLSCEQDKCKLAEKPNGLLAPGASHSE